MSKRMILTMKVIMSMQAEIAISLMTSIIGANNIRRAIVIMSRRVSTLKISRKITIEIMIIKRTL
jgi:hypothetical protein